MEVFISEIYNYAQLIPATKEIIEKYYEFDDLHGKRMWDEISDLFITFCNEVYQYNPSLAKKIINSLESACAHTLTEPQNFNLMASTLEETLPLLYEAMSYFGQIDTEEGQYRLLSSKSGYLTLVNTSINKYYHDILDPYHEAYILAKRIYKPIYTSFKFLGCGLGYLPLNIFAQSDLSAEIYIFHNNPTIIDYAFHYGVLSLIPEDKLHIVINENIDELLDEYENIDLIEVSGMYNIFDVFDTANDTQKNRISQIHINFKGSFLFENQLEINLWRNLLHVTKPFSDFKDYNPEAPWIVVAAGPSLDTHLDYIKENDGNKNIICASTVLKKLLNYGITPTCVAVLDPQSRTYNHFDGLEDTSIPLILNSTGNWKFGEYYNGPKYYIPSYTDNSSILYFKSKNMDSYNLGSTVSSMSICLALLYKAKRIELIGIDLSFPNGYTHAKGTMDRKEIDKSKMISVPSVNGETVLSSPGFIHYAQQINTLIENNPTTEFINFSDNGIKLNKCKWYKDLN